MPQPIAQQPAPDGLEILIVDDDELLCERVEQLLASKGIRSISVNSLQMAGEAMRAVYFPVVVLDRRLGDGDGLALCREYRARQVDRRVSILVLSSQDSAADAKTAIAAGADAFLSKRSSDSELIERVTQLYAVAAGRISPPSEPGSSADRTRALAQYGITDTPPEQEYDDVVRIAATLCRVPIALISFVDDERQWFKAKSGLSLAETPREHAFCAHAIASPDEIMVVQDALQDERFATNPLVTGDPQIRFYAGAPLVTADGHTLGTICVMDRVPRNLEPQTLDALAALARQVIILLEQRKTRAELEHALTAMRAADADSRRAGALFAEAFENAPIGIALVSASGHWLRVNRSLCEILGYMPEQLLSTTFQAITHPEDLQADLSYVEALLSGAIRTYEMEKRYIRKNSESIWALLSVSLVRDDAGTPLYFISQVQDISDRKRPSLTQ
jgi:PAS domain S-box-containing protein